MKAVITVIGKDAVGILANVSAVCAKNNVNITDVTQSVQQDVFAMIMMAEISDCSVEFSDFVDQMEKLGEQTGMTIYVTHEDLFNSMHRI